MLDASACDADDGRLSVDADLRRARFVGFGSETLLSRAVELMR